MTADWIVMQTGPAPAGWFVHYVRLSLSPAAVAWTAEGIKTAEVVHVRAPVVCTIVRHQLDRGEVWDSTATLAVLDHESGQLVPPEELGEHRLANVPELLDVVAPGEPAPTAERVAAVGEHLRRVAARDGIRFRNSGLEVRPQAALVELAGRAGSADELTELYELACLAGAWSETVREAFTARSAQLEDVGLEAA